VEIPGDVLRGVAGAGVVVGGVVGLAGAGVGATGAVTGGLT
jgi:hypothetical protein